MWSSIQVLTVHNYWTVYHITQLTGLQFMFTVYSLQQVIQS